MQHQRKLAFDTLRRRIQPGAKRSGWHAGNLFKLFGEFAPDGQGSVAQDL